MLVGTKSVTLSYQSTIDGVTAVYMSASMAEEGQASVNTTIQNKELYEKNKEECRKDIEAFSQIVFALEDNNNDK